VLEVFRLAVPDLGRLGVLRSSETGVVSAAELRGIREYLAEPGALPITVVEELVGSVEELSAAVDRLAAADVQAIWIPIDFLVYSNLEVVRAAAEPHGLPLVSSSLKGARAGAVAGVLVDYALLGQRAILIALAILENTISPGEIPVGRMTGYQVVVNLAAARACGYELPLSLLALADAIIDDEP
jgi:ABC-type uncharacterized transport system substrate-binding protein